MVLENRLATNINRAAIGGGLLEGVYPVPQPAISIVIVKMSTERTALLSDMSFLLLEFEGY